MGNVILENPETETRWYFRYFLGSSHQNFLATLNGNDDELEVVLLSVLTADDGSIRAILWRKTGSERLLTKGQRGKNQEAKKILGSFGHGMPEKVKEVRACTIATWYSTCS